MNLKITMAWTTTWTMACVFWAASPAQAQTKNQSLDLAEVSSVNLNSAAHMSWHVDFSPYFWAPSVAGKSTVGPLSSNVNASFHDILRNTDVLGAMGRLELRQGPVAVFVDGVYMDGSTDFSASNGAAAAKTTVNFRASTVDFGAAYQVFSHEFAGHRVSIGILGGGRYTNFKQTLDIQNLGPLGVTTNLGGTAEWIEPIVGGRAQVALAKDLVLHLYGDVGGFHVGYADLSWKARGVIAWYVRDNVALVAGYQAYGLDYVEGSGAGRNGFDGVMLGPVLGLNIRF